MIGRQLILKIWTVLTLFYWEFQHKSLIFTLTTKSILQMFHSTINPSQYWFSQIETKWPSSSSRGCSKSAQELKEHRQMTAVINFPPVPILSVVTNPMQVLLNLFFTVSCHEVPPWQITGCKLPPLARSRTGNCTGITASIVRSRHGK